MKKTNYFYIDEAGNLGNDSKTFIHGCIKTDSPHILRKAIKIRIGELASDLYFEGIKDRILKEGFHAVENHPDIRADFYKILPLLDYRGYFVVLDKTSNYFTTLKREKEEYEIFEYSLRKLLIDRVTRNKLDRNIFYFEKLNIKKKSLDEILSNFFNSLDSEIDCEYHIVDKKEENISVVDYLNYIFYEILDGYHNGKEKNRMKLNFDLISSKVAVINILHKNSFLSRKKNRIKYDNFINEFGG